MARARRVRGWTLAALLILGVSSRLALPGLLRAQITRRIDAVEGLDGWVQDVDLALLRGVFVVEGLRVLSEKTREPLLTVERATLTLRWRELLEGRLTASALVERPVVNWVEGAYERRAAKPGQGGAGKPKADRRKLARFDRLEIRDGLVRYRDPRSDPPVDLRLESIGALASNLTNRAGDTATVSAQAKPMGDGGAWLEVRAKPLAESPTFDLDLSLRDLDLARLNPLLRSKTKLDAERGELDLVVEAAAKDGIAKGYVKPVLRGAELGGGKRKNPFRELLAGASQLGVEFLENEKSGQVAAKIPFEGPIPEPEAGVWAAVVSVTRNAFVRALSPRLEDSIGPEDLRSAPGPKRKR